MTPGQQSVWNFLPRIDIANEVIVELSPEVRLTWSERRDVEVEVKEQFGVIVRNKVTILPTETTDIGSGEKDNFGSKLVTQWPDERTTRQSGEINIRFRPCEPTNDDNVPIWLLNFHNDHPPSKYEELQPWRTSQNNEWCAHGISQCGLWPPVCHGKCKLRTGGRSEFGIDRVFLYSVRSWFASLK